MSQKPIAKTGLALVALTLALSAPPLEGGIISYRDESGRLVFVNSADTEMSRAASAGGARAAIRVLDQRKARLPGIDEYLEETARANDVDAKLVQAMIEVESAWDPRARSKMGAMGLMQLMPGTAKRFGVRNPLDPSDNISGGIRYLRFLLDRFDGDITLTLAAYNAGENAVAAYGGVPPYQETMNYVTRVREVYDKLNEGVPTRLGSIYPTVDRNGRLVFAN